MLTFVGDLRHPGACLVRTGLSVFRYNNIMMAP